MIKKLSIILFFIITSCSKNLELENNKNLFKSGFDTNNLEFTNVYLDDTKLYIESLYKNHSYYFIGDISKIKQQNTLDTRIFANRIIDIDIPRTKEDEQKLQTKLKNKNNLKKITIIKYEQWSKIILPILEKTIINIVPKEKDKAIMVSIANRDMAIFYNEKNMITIERVEKIDKNIGIVKTYSEKSFYNLLAIEIRKIPQIQKSNDDFIIFELSGDEKTESPYVLFDNRNGMQYYFNYSSLFTAKERARNTDYYIQIIFNTFVKAHIIEPIKNPVTTVQKGSTFVYQAIKKTLESKDIKELKEIPPLNYDGKMMDINQFEKELDNLVGEKKHKGSMEFLIGGPAFFTDFLNEIDKAKEEIFIRLYIYSNDDYGVRLSNILKNKDNSGVDVRILTAGLANNAESMKRTAIPFDKDFKQPKSIGQYLAYDSTINFRTSADTFFLFDHSKMIILDKKVAYAGGMNIGQPYRYTWHDMMVKLKGPIVHTIRGQFMQAWSGAGPTGDLGRFSRYIYNFNPPSKELTKYYFKNSENHADIRILYTKPQQKQIYKAQLHAINSAKKFIYIQNPYLADYKIINALIEARGRGVDVRIIIPLKNNVGMMAASNLVMTNIFLKNGIRVFSYQGMTHIKAAIYDSWASLGSANFDNLSLMKNDEFNIAFSDPRYVEKLKRELFDVDFKLSEEITKPYIINWYDKMMSSFANRF